MVRTRCGFAVVSLLIVCFSGCAGTARQTTQRPSPIQLAGHTTASDTHTVYVVGHGWHTGLAVKTSEVDTELLPEVADFSDLDYIEVGWGDEGFYRAQRITPQLVVRAAFWPTPSVLHVAGFFEPPQHVFEFSDIVELELSRAEFDRLCQFIGDTLSRDGEGRSKVLGRGIYGESLFYRAKDKYYVPKTCNIWTARALRIAGLPINHLTAIRAENVIAQSRRIGRQIQQSPSWIKKAALFGGDESGE